SISPISNHASPGRLAAFSKPSAGFESGGEGGIRTPGTRFSAYNGLANRRLKPLGHLSARAAASRRYAILPGISNRAEIIPCTHAPPPGPGTQGSAGFQSAFSPKVVHGGSPRPASAPPISRWRIIPRRRTIFARGAQHPGIVNVEAAEAVALRLCHQCEMRDPPLRFARGVGDVVAFALRLLRRWTFLLSQRLERRRIPPARSLRIGRELPGNLAQRFRGLPLRLAGAGRAPVRYDV